MYIENYEKMRIKWLRDEITLEDWYYFSSLCLEELMYNNQEILKRLKNDLTN